MHWRNGGGGGGGGGGHLPTSDLAQRWKVDKYAPENISVFSVLGDGVSPKVKNQYKVYGNK